MTRQEALQQQMDEIMDTFDFSCAMKLRRVILKHLEIESEFSESEMRKTARRMMQGVIKDGGFSSCGGFTALIQSGTDEDGDWSRLMLFFGIDGLAETGDGVSHE